MEWDRDFVGGARSALKVIEEITQNSGAPWCWPSGWVVLLKTGQVPLIYWIDGNQSYSTTGAFCSSYYDVSSQAG